MLPFKRFLLGCEAFGYVLVQFLRAPFCINRDPQLKELLSGLVLSSRASRLRLKPLDLKDFFKDLPPHTIQVFEYPLSLLDRRTRPRISLTSCKERVFMAMLLAKQRPRRVFEFGTAHGGTLYNLALNAPQDCEFFSMDIKRLGREGPVLNEFFADPRVHRILCDSRRFDYAPLSGSCDLIFVDACHSYEMARHDSLKAFEMLSPDGIILWHDYHAIPQFKTGVRPFLEKLSHALELRYVPGTSLAIFNKTRNTPSLSHLAALTSK